MTYEEMRAELKSRPRRDLMHPQERCPSSEVLAAYASDQLDEATRSHVSVHLALCNDCSMELSTLEHLERSAAWRELIDSVRSFVIDLARTYSPGTVLGAARIVEQAAGFATRGDDADAKPVFTILEIDVRNNRYSLEVALTPSGSLTVDIAGIDTPDPTPLSVIVRLENGDELVSMATDAHGNGQFQLPAVPAPRPLYLVTLELSGTESHVPIVASSASGSG